MPTMTQIAQPKVTCRICKATTLESVLDFGEIALTGVFERIEISVPKAEMNLGRCTSCGLVQLLHTYDQELLYGSSYGYESHLNSGMVQHLKSKAASLESRFFSIPDSSTDSFIVVDIASNDGTLLNGYSSRITKVGIDPLIDVVDDCYPAEALKIQSFFSADAYFSVMKEKADLVTSLSVIYDLDDPITFAEGVASILKEGGIWHLEQSYLPLMCSTLSYDTICHEHLLYLSLHDIKSILENSGFQILDVSLNDVNGGSIAVTAKKSVTELNPEPFVNYLLEKENVQGYRDGSALRLFAEKSHQHKLEISKLINEYNSEGYKIFALGASTKGNVMLQWAGLSASVIQSVGDINPKKFGKRTPGSDIPITSEKNIIELSDSKTLILVLPWHFRSGIIKNCRQVLDNGSKFLFPLPSIEVVAS